MASQNFTYLANAFAEGAINYRTAAFKCLLVTSVPSEANLDAWVDRADVTNEHAATGNYTTGGFALTAAVEATPDTTNNNIEVTFSETSTPAIASATITCVGAIIYLSTGVAANDLLISFVDFGGTVTRTAANFSITFDNPLPINV